jgi:hypothetical protein
VFYYLLGLFLNFLRFLPSKSVIFVVFPLNSGFFFNTSLAACLPLESRVELSFQAAALCHIMLLTSFFYFLLLNSDGAGLTSSHDAKL